MGCHFLLQGSFLTQRLNPHLLCLLLWQADKYICQLGSPVTAVKQKIDNCIDVDPDPKTATELPQGQARPSQDRSGFA